MLSAVPSVPSKDEEKFVAAVKRTQAVLQLANLGTKARAKKAARTPIKAVTRGRAINNRAATHRAKKK